nr:hypothetical protein CFP56_24741 [Quercus suber]
MKFHELAFDREENKSQTLRQVAENEGGSLEVGNPLSAELEKMKARVCIEEEKGINDGPFTNNEQTAEVDKQKEIAAFNSNSSSGPRFTLPKKLGLSLNENYTLPKMVVLESPINSQEYRSFENVEQVKENLFDIQIKEIDTELSKFDEDPDFMVCTLKQSQRQVFYMVNIPNKEKTQQQQ